MFSRDRARLAALADVHSTLDPLSRVRAVCRLCLSVTGVSGVSLSVAGGGSPAQRAISTVWGTDVVSLRLEELQLGLGEGPIADALKSTLPVLESDLSDVSHRRWRLFAPAAARSGVAAVFVLPLCAGEWCLAGEKCLGALSLYRSSTGDLTVEQYDDFRDIADAVMEILRSDSAESGGEPGKWTVGPGTGFQPEIPQAVGVIMSALGIDADQALDRLRGHAFAAEQPISAVARDIVSGRIRLERDTD
jgi:ANTAR domain